MMNVIMSGLEAICVPRTYGTVLVEVQYMEISTSKYLFFQISFILDGDGRCHNMPWRAPDARW